MVGKQGDEMTKFTSEFIAFWRNTLKVVAGVRGGMMEIEKFALEALDHIERLQKRIAELESVNEDQALTISQNDYAYTIDKEMMEKRIAELETYIDDCQSKPCYANKKEEARKKINDILAHALTERKEDYYLDGKYFRWGKLEKDIMEVVDNIFVDGGNENAK